MKKFFPTAIILGLLSVALLIQARPVHAQALKVAIVDLNKAMNEVDEGKAAVARLEQQFNKKKAELEKKGQAIQALKTDLDMKSSVLSDQAKRDRIQELQEKATAFQQEQMEADQEMNLMRNKLQSDLAEKLKGVCADISKKEGYSRWKEY